MQKNLGASSANRPGSTYHLLTNFLIDPHGDTATAWSRWNFVVTGPDNSPKIMYGGHYDDTLVRENGHWKFKKRIAVNDIPAGNSAPPPTPATIEVQTTAETPLSTEADRLGRFRHGADATGDCPRSAVREYRCHLRRDGAAQSK